MSQAKSILSFNKTAFLLVSLCLLVAFGANTGYAQSPAVEEPKAQVSTEAKTDKNNQAKEKEKEAVLKVDSSPAGEESEDIISISDAMKQGQLKHEKNLVDKFLLGIAVMFLVIAFLLFNSLPPSSPETGS